MAVVRERSERSQRMLLDTPGAKPENGAGASSGGRTEGMKKMSRWGTARELQAVMTAGHLASVFASDGEEAHGGRTDSPERMAV